MEAAHVSVALPEEPRRIRRRMLRAVAARQLLEATPRPHARAWINGRDVGSVEARFAHLSRVHD